MEDYCKLFTKLATAVYATNDNELSVLLKSQYKRTDATSRPVSVTRTVDNIQSVHDEFFADLKSTDNRLGIIRAVQRRKDSTDPAVKDCVVAVWHFSSGAELLELAEEIFETCICTNARAYVCVDTAPLSSIAAMVMTSICAILTGSSPLIPVGALVNSAIARHTSKYWLIDIDTESGNYCLFFLGSCNNNNKNLLLLLASVVDETAAWLSENCIPVKRIKTVSGTHFLVPRQDFGPNHRAFKTKCCDNKPVELLKAHNPETLLFFCPLTKQ